jgi:hypothetical protein
MDERIAAGLLNPYLATAWAQKMYFGLVGEYLQSDAAERATFIARYCAEASHTAWCSGIVIP